MRPALSRLFTEDDRECLTRALVPWVSARIERMRFVRTKRLVTLLTVSLVCPAAIGADDWSAAGDVGEEQIREKQEIRDMRNEMDDINSTIKDATQKFNELSTTLNQEANRQEVHLFARESDWSTSPTSSVHCLTYNGKIPGPVIRVMEGQMVRVVLHNQLTVPTSLRFHGVIAPHSVNGLPRSGAGLVAPGKTYAFQFRAGQSGTFWYQPQIVHQDQRQLGLYGTLIVAPHTKMKTNDKDVTLVFSQIYKVKRTSAASKGTAYSAVASTQLQPAPGVECDYLVNGKEAPAIEPIELRKGERVLLRLVNASQEAIPLHLSGHRMKLVAINGSDKLEPHVVRDTFTLNPSDRVDAEFVADNPGVWSLASELAHQATKGGKFPGGMACVVRYSEARAKAKTQ